MHAKLQELWEDVLSRHSGSGFGAEEQVLGHVLGPSSLCRFSLRDTLANLGAQLTMGELEACGVQELRAYVAGAVQTLQRRCDSWRRALARGLWVVGCGSWQRHVMRVHGARRQAVMPPALQRRLHSQGMATATWPLCSSRGCFCTGCVVMQAAHRFCFSSKRLGRGMLPGGCMSACHHLY